MEEKGVFLLDKEQVIVQYFIKNMPCNKKFIVLKVIFEQTFNILAV